MTCDAAARIITLTASYVGDYTYELTTVNNAGADVPVSGARVISFRVAPADLGSVTVRYGERLSILANLDSLNWASIQDDDVNGYSDGTFRPNSTLPVPR